MDLPLPAIAILISAAFFGGLVDAIAGGGGLVTLPTLLAVGLPPHVALGTNKAQSVFGTASALTRFWRHGAVNPRRARVTFPLSFVGSLVGAFGVLLLDPGTLRPVVLALLVLAAAVVAGRPAGGSPGASATARTHPRVAIVVIFLIAAYDGFFGPGTGTFLIVALVSLLGVPMLHASADAKVVNFASNLAAVVLFASKGVVEWRVAVPMAAAQLAGGAFGAHVAIRGGERIIRVAVLIVAAALCVKLGHDMYAG